jgi:Cof subfamily protein (haloacid dehalogenase superfamily)
MANYLFSDIDGTLIHSEGISKTTLNKIKSFIAGGNHFYCVTGRNDLHVQQLQKLAGLDLEYRISQNGCVVKDRDDNLLYSNTLDTDIARNIANFLDPIVKKHDFLFGASMVDGVRYYNKKTSTMNPNYFTDENFKDKIGKDLFPALFLVIADSEDYFDEIKNFISSNYGDSVSCVLTSFGVLEILQNTASKANGISFVLNKEKITTPNIFVVGDNENDVSMFQKFPNNAFSMVKAVDYVKSYTNFSTHSVGDLIDYINNNQLNAYKVNKEIASCKYDILLTNPSFSYKEIRLNEISDFSKLNLPVFLKLQENEVDGSFDSIANFMENGGWGFILEVENKGNISILKNKICSYVDRYLKNELINIYSKNY